MEILKIEIWAEVQTNLDSFFLKHRPVIEESELQAGPSSFQDTPTT
jgi:hypothetical protein